MIAAAAEFREVLACHAARYPRMAPCDGVKLAYQATFGGGHLISDPAASLDRLKAELAQVEPDPAAPLAEDIGNGLVRISLRALAGGGDTPDGLNRAFVRSAQNQKGTRTELLERLEVLRSLTAQGSFGFSVQDLEEYLGPYQAAGCPPVSHSPQYRAAYRPAYRVIARRFSLPLCLAELSARAGRGEGPVLVALDGRCAAGKTTLAGRLAKEYGFPVVHMDHFFLRPEQRTPERLAQPGGNVDYERVQAEVLTPLRRGEGAVYRPFVCKTQRLAEPITIPPAPVVLVEGSYACHPHLWPSYDVRVFLTVSPALQRERLLMREGAEGVQVFYDKWIPLEERYCSALQVEDRCGYSLEAPV